MLTQSVLLTRRPQSLAGLLPSLGEFAKGFCKQAKADGGSGRSPTIHLPRLAVKFFSSNIQQQHRKSLRIEPTVRRISSKMAATKDYRLLCLENPLLGKQTPTLAPGIPLNGMHGTSHFPLPRQRQAELVKLTEFYDRHPGRRR